MALVGNFAYQNYDHTAKTTGPGPQGSALGPATLSEGTGPPSTFTPSPGSDSEQSQDNKNRPFPTGDEKVEPLQHVQSSDDIEGDRREKEVLALARKYTNQSTTSTYTENPFNAKEDSVLNPHSPNFKARAWTKSLLNLQAREPEKWQPRTTGFAFRNLNVYGFGSSTDYQKTVSNVWLGAVGVFRKVLGLRKRRRIDILQHLEGVVHSGEMLVVLGPPGSGCSTCLKTVAGETHGFFVDEKSCINYQGITPKQMHKDFRGEAIYTAEVDVHFPMLTVGETLSFAAQARAPRHIPGDISRQAYAEHIRDVIMAVFGISHTINTRVGNDFVRGVSGGERKRVSIAEAALSAAPLQCWDNSTRGLDSANAVEFCKTLRMSTDLAGSTACVAIYQAPQNAYNIFDKVIVLYEGRQIYFGRCADAQHYFETLGFDCPDRQTTADFLTSMTSPIERIVRAGFEDKVPRTPDEFADVWKSSRERARLLQEVDDYDNKYAIGGEHLEKFKASRRLHQAKRQRVKSPYTLSYAGQVGLCLRRGFWRLKGDPSLAFTQLFGNFLMAIVIGSVFYNLPVDTNSFYSRSALLFFAILLNAFGSALEILTLYAQRPIVEKHSRYGRSPPSPLGDAAYRHEALYHPSSEAIASILTDMPYKILNAIIFNLTLYFLTNLRRTPGAFFFFFLISFLLTLVMSMLFRTIASVSRTLTEALTPTSQIMLALVIYTGFALPIPYMHGWARWINYVDPVSYGFEALMINEFNNRDYACSTFVPSGPEYTKAGDLERTCSAVGSVAGKNFVNGTDYIASAYLYYDSHKWRDFGILWVFLIGLCGTYLLSTEYITAKKSKGEVLLFRRRHAPTTPRQAKQDDEEAAVGHRPVGSKKSGFDTSVKIEKQTAIFHWRDVCYDIKIKKKTRRILDHVDGWVKPGTLTGLMGVSGAGKTTLLDVLATRTTMGIISGDMLVDGRQRDTSFQRKTGYVQQQDLHLSTSTVREALKFSALLRQPAHIAHAEKLAYVEEVIKLLEMEDFSDAVVGVPGEGLNVEQRKRLTIAVELAAKPQLLLFLDEPTSGLDSQTSWAICDLMERLTKNGQAVLCTIHQPSAMLFQRFDRLLFLAEGGKTVYFGEVGENSNVLIGYFEKNGASVCPMDANPAEWMLEVIGAAPGSHSEIDWHQVWRESPEYEAVHCELDRLKEGRPKETRPAASPDDKTSFREFAAPFALQQWEVTKRVFEQYWRTPSYIYSKASLCILAGLFIGFSFYDAGTSLQSLQNQMFAIFMLFTIFGQLVQQIMPHFVTQRSLYEARERPSKTYSWKAFMLSNIIVELPWNALMAVFIFFCLYYPIGLYKNTYATDSLYSRGGLMFLLILAFLLFTSTFTNMVIAAIDTAETAGNIAQLLFSLTLIFCGVLASPATLPRFWIFMYRLSPFTYLISAILSTAVANTAVVCAANELLHFEPPAGQTCGVYMSAYIEATGGYLEDPSAKANCGFCPIDSTNTFLAAVNSNFSTRWRDFGILWVFIIFNVVAAVVLYWLVRVPKKEGKSKKE